MNKDVLYELVSYAWPGRDRGPAYPNWLKMMKTVALQLGWGVCYRCLGSGEVSVNSTWRSKDCCIECYGIGKRKIE